MNIALPDGSVKELAAGATVADVAASIGAGLAKAALAGKVDGTLVDLTATVTDGATVEIITAKSPEALHIMRHSCAHIMAEAVQELYPGTQIAFGPATDDGYFYDFELPNNISSDDFGAIEKKMAEIVKADEPFVREVVSIDEAKKIFADQRFKLEHIDDLTDQEISIYRHRSFVDLCAGPHVPSAGKIGAFKMMKLAGAYSQWRRDAPRAAAPLWHGLLQEVGASRSALHNLEEAEKRDYRRTAGEMDIFAMRDEALVLPAQRHDLEEHIASTTRRARSTRRPATEISTPDDREQAAVADVGPLGITKDNMYSTVIDEEEYCVKPMNCLQVVYASKLHSYRDLPIRATAWCAPPRWRAAWPVPSVRCFNQDDAHLFVRLDS